MEVGDGLGGLDVLTLCHRAHGHSELLPSASLPGWCAYVEELWEAGAVLWDEVRPAE